MEYVTVTVAPGMTYVKSINGENLIYTAGQTVSVLAVEYIYLKRDGVML